MLSAFAEQSRAAKLRHPWLIEVLARIPYALTPNMVATIEQALRSLDDLNVEADSMMAAVDTVVAYVHGATAAEIAKTQLMARHGWTSDDDVRLELAPQVRRLSSTGRYPAFTRYVVEGSNQDNHEWRFAFGLECVLDGIAARLGI